MHSVISCLLVRSLVWIPYLSTRRRFSSYSLGVITDVMTLYIVRIIGWFEGGFIIAKWNIGQQLVTDGRFHVSIRHCDWKREKEEEKTLYSIDYQIGITWTPHGYHIPTTWASHATHTGSQRNRKWIQWLEKKKSKNKRLCHSLCNGQNSLQV